MTRHIKAVHPDIFEKEYTGCASSDKIENINVADNKSDSKNDDKSDDKSCSHDESGDTTDCEEEDTKTKNSPKSFAQSNTVRQYHWERKYVRKINEDDHECVLCSTIIKSERGNSANLKRHIRRQHPDIYEKEEQCNNEEIFIFESIKSEDLTDESEYESITDGNSDHQNETNDDYYDKNDIDDVNVKTHNSIGSVGIVVSKSHFQSYEYTMIPTQRGKHLLMMNRYTYSQMKDSRNYYCSKKDMGCKARVKLDSEGGVANAITEHKHPPPNYMLTSQGYIKL
ncbi:unnamed protein product [Diatraea saccharalis]|nr:unnamed protein product [Diatraea saccharalis]